MRQPSSLHFKFADRLCRTTRVEVIVCIYPKAPEHTYNETLLAISELYGRLLRTHSSEDIIIGGDSAGGTVAVLIPAYLEKKAFAYVFKDVSFQSDADCIAQYERCT